MMEQKPFGLVPRGLRSVVFASGADSLGRLSPALWINASWADAVHSATTSPLLQEKVERTQPPCKFYSSSVCLTDKAHACWHPIAFAANLAALNVHVFLCVRSCIGFESRAGGGRTILLFPVYASRDSLVLRWKTRHCPLFPPWDVLPSHSRFSHSRIWNVTLTSM